MTVSPLGVPDITLSSLGVLIRVISLRVFATTVTSNGVPAMSQISWCPAITVTSLDVLAISQLS